MSGWLVSLTYEANAGVPILDALFACWKKDRAEAIRDVAALDPVGSRVVPQIVVQLDASKLRGLHLRPGETARLRIRSPSL
jgi:hypothetical protein